MNDKNNESNSTSNAESKKASEILTPASLNRYERKTAAEKVAEDPKSEKIKKSKAELLKTVDSKEKTEANFIKQMETSDFLNMDRQSRLSLITKGDTKGDTLEFNFSANGEKNKNLYLNASLGQVLSEDVSTVTSGNITYERHGLNGEFYDPKTGERLLIDDGTKITVGKPKRSKDELEKMKGEIKEKYDSFTKELGIDEKNLKEGETEKLELIQEAFKKGLDKKEIKLILEGKYEELNNIKPESKKKEILKNLLDLKNKGLLDGDNSGNTIEKKELEEFAKKYGIPAGAMSMGSGAGGGGSYAEYSGQTPPSMNLEGTPEQAKKAVEAAMSQLGIHENSGKADKYLKGIGYTSLSARTTPWCAAFINRSLKQAGFDIQSKPSLAAKSFIQESGKGHVGFKVGNQLLGGNQSNRVSLKHLNYGKVKGWIMPGEKEIHNKGTFNKGNIPDGAIVVFNR